MGERLEETLRRLKTERDEADRRYNDALTILDRSQPGPFDLPSLPPPADERQLAALNEAWNTLPAPPRFSGLKGRVVAVVWRIVAPYLQRQLTFNSLLVDHLNRSAAAARDARRADEEMMAVLRDRFAAITEFTARLMAYLQQITAYVDTKDRDTASGALVLNASISGLAETADKRWESLSARFETRTAALAAAHEALRRTDDTLRTMIAVSQQAAVSLKREVERLLASPAGVGASASDAAAGIDPSAHAFAPSLDAYKYLGFEDLFRGSREAIRGRFESYVPLFAGASDVLDVGCGRGEFLELLGSAGISARGVDLNHEMAEQCRARGLDVVESDAAGHLAALPDASLGGIFAAQVVEHLQPAYLLRFLELAFHKLRPGGTIVLETLNPACWVAFFDSYIRDITHAWPLHPDTLKYLVLASGFSGAEIEYRSPVPPQDKLQTIVIPEGVDAALSDVAEVLNENAEKLNSRIFTFMDYAIVGRR